MITVVKFQDVRQFWRKADQVWDSPNFVYIGRENARYNLPRSIWANPFVIQDEKNEDQRQRAIKDYRDYLLHNLLLLRKIRDLRGKTLVCWCAPKPCHGHVLAELAALPDEELDKLIK